MDDELMETRKVLEAALGRVPDPGKSTPQLAREVVAMLPAPGADYWDGRNLRCGRCDGRTSEIDPCDCDVAVT